MESTLSSYDSMMCNYTRNRAKKKIMIVFL